MKDTFEAGEACSVVTFLPACKSQGGRASLSPLFLGV